MLLPKSQTDRCHSYEKMGIFQPANVSLPEGISTIYPPDLREKMFNPPKKTTLRKLFCGHDLDIIFLYIPSSSFFRRRGYSGIRVLYQCIRHIHPGRLTWNLRIHLWKRRSLLETIIFRFYVKLQACIFSSNFIATVRLHQYINSRPPWVAFRFALQFVSQTSCPPEWYQRPHADLFVQENQSQKIDFL